MLNTLEPPPDEKSSSLICIGQKSADTLEYPRRVKDEDAIVSAYTCVLIFFGSSDAYRAQHFPKRISKLSQAKPSYGAYDNHAHLQTLHLKAHLCGEHDASNAAGVHEAAASDLSGVQHSRLQQVLNSVLHLRSLAHVDVGCEALPQPRAARNMLTRIRIPQHTAAYQIHMLAIGMSSQHGSATEGMQSGILTAL